MFTQTLDCPEIDFKSWIKAMTLGVFGSKCEHFPDFVTRGPALSTACFVHRNIVSQKFVCDHIQIILCEKT